MGEQNVLRVPVRPSQEPCGECGRPATQAEPNLQYSLVGISGVLCRPCLNRELKAVNGVLQEGGNG